MRDINDEEGEYGRLFAAISYELAEWDAVRCADGLKPIFMTRPFP